MKFKLEELKEILEIAKRGNDFSEIYFESSKSSVLSLSDSKIKEVNNGINTGIGIRILDGIKTIYGYTNEITYDGVISLAKTLNIKNLNNLNNVENNNLANINFELKIAPTTVKEKYEDVILERKADILNYAEKHARKVCKSKISQFTAAYSDTTKEIEIINSNGNWIKETINRGIYRNNIILEKDGNIQTGYDALGTTSGFEFFNLEKIEKCVNEGIRIAELLFIAKPSVSGVYDIVLSGTAGGTMIHEACGHGLELDLIQEEVSIFRNLKGKQIANEKVTVIDNGLNPEFFGTTYYDSEGIKTEKTILVENGILKEYMNSIVSAKKSKITKLTGNGRRESYKFPPLPRMRNTYIDNGTDDVEDMIRNTENGVYIKKMGGGQVDTVTGNFIFAATEAYMIENGKITHPLKNASLQGNGSQVLKNITKVGNDLKFTVGVCGKGGQGVPVTSGQPTIKIKQMTIGGSQA